MKRRFLCLLLVMVLLCSMLPTLVLAEEPATLSLSILGDSISTYTGVSNDVTVNSTLKGGAIYYNAGTLGVYRNDTWWQQTVDQMGMKLLVNNSWSGSCVLKERSGTVGAYLDRCVQLHNDAGEDPDIIAVYLGTNDFWTFPDTLGTAEAIDYASLIVTDEQSTEYAVPTTTCEAYAIMLHKMKQRYPNAEIYCFTLLPRGNQSVSKVQQLQSFNSSLKQIAAYFDAYTVDLYNDSGIKADENFKFYVADNSLHPGPAGMDAITGSFTSSLLNNSQYTNGGVYQVSYDLNGVIVDQGTASAVLGGSTFTCSFTVAADHILKVKVTMGGEDITADCSAGKSLTIPNVSGDIQITAFSELAPEEPENFRWECINDQMVSITELGNTANELTMTQGSISDGKFKNVKYTLNEAIILRHDQPWVFEWKSEGTWSDTTDGALLLAGNASSSVADTPYLYRRHNSDFIAFGFANGGRYYNYGVALGANGIDGTVEHTYRLENRIFEDGSNMVYLLVDGQEVAPMNHHWIGGTDQKTTVDWVNGRDFVFTHMGTSPHTIGNCFIDYIQVCENGHIHSYTSTIIAPTCAEQGYTAYICTCGDAYESDFVAATGNHSYKKGNCTVCGAIEPETPQNFRWDCINDQMVSATEFGNTANDLTMTQGSITDGKFKNVKYTFSEKVVLKHDRPWIFEWKSEGTWSDTTDGALLLAGNASSSVVDTPYLYRRYNSDFIAFGFANGGRYYNYGVALGANGIDGTVEHTYRLENRIFEDGSNMVYLLVDGQEVGPMNHHWIGGTDQKTTVDWVNGRDFVFTHMGTSPHTIGNCSIDYIQIWENGHVHSYVSATIEPTCAEQGYTAYRCNCGNYYEADFVAATGNHSYKNNICTGCGEVDPDLPQNFRWECKEDQMVTITEFGNTANDLTMTQGSITDGKFKNVKYTFSEKVVLKHDHPWIYEWKSEGTWSDTTDGALLLAGNASSSVADTPYLYRRHNSDFIAFGFANGGRYYNYGVALGANGIDGTVEHTYRLENRIFEDGSNMVYLLVDGQEMGPMNHHWIGGTDQKTTVDWVNGRDFVFTHMGTSPHTIGNCSIDYIQIWENGHTHRYEQGFCIGCGEADPDYVVIPTLTLKAPTLEFKDMICVVAFYTAENIENVVQMGMITYKNQVEVIDIQTADHVIPGATYEETTNRYFSTSQGIHAKYLSDTVYLACYAQLTDGTYVYTKLAPYSPITYATNQLENSTDTKLKQLVVAMLNYGAAAQNYFAYKVDTPANNSLSVEELALPESYRPEMVAPVPVVTAEKQGSFANNKGFASKRPAVSFEGAFSINYFFTPVYEPTDGITLYYWTETDFNANDVLTADNASGSIQMTGVGTEQYRGDIVGIAAKSLSQAIYVAAVYSDGTSDWTSGVLGYSIGAYCSSLATKGGTMAELAMATAVYGYQAKAYFG